MCTARVDVGVRFCYGSCLIVAATVSRYCRFDLHAIFHVNLFTAIENKSLVHMRHNFLWMEIFASFWDTERNLIADFVRFTGMYGSSDHVVDPQTSVLPRCNLHVSSASAYKTNPISASFLTLERSSKDCVSFGTCF